MRKDMKKVLTTRPRYSGINAPTRQKINLSDLTDDFELEEDVDFPNKISAKRDSVGKGEEKFFSDLMGPIRRYLTSNTDRPWSEVWSEICQNNKDFMGDHLKMHIEWIVAQKCKLIDGVPYDSGHEVYSYSARKVFYVHPDTGILHEAPRRKRERWSKKEKQQKIVTIKKQKYFNFKGKWFRIETKDANGLNSYQIMIGDVFGDFSYMVSFNKQLTERYGEHVIVTKKEDVNSRELKKLKSL